MAGSLSEDNGSDSISVRCQSGDSEWRSCEQVENGTPSTSPAYWDIDDMEDTGPKPSQLYGKFTWKIENFSQISKRELRSNAFEVGGFKWYILVYPQGCDVCNHLSLFLCVANYDKLYPGWSHFAQFTIAVVNKDPKKSKYSDTLHRFWKKEHDWGWKKFMELSKVLDGFIVGDTLVIKAQVQVIREKSNRLFRCLDSQYRRELVRVYLTNVEGICRRFVEERRGKLGKLIEDEMRWSSFRAFWLGVDQNARRRMSREKADVILKIVVKHFFIEKEVTSTLVMDSLYSGLLALEDQSKNKKGWTKLVELEETPSPIVHKEKDMFVLADDVLILLERVATEPLPPSRDDKGPQNRTKEGNSGEDFNKDSIERDERRLTELGRRTVEIFVLAHIFSHRIEVAYQEAVALMRQEELIREEEAAGQAEIEHKAKRGAEKEKRSKKKQSKQRRSSGKGKDRGREERSDVVVQDKHKRGKSPHDESSEDLSLKQVQSILEKSNLLEGEASGVSDTGDDVSGPLGPDMEDGDAGPVNWDTDTSEMHNAAESCCSSISCPPTQNGQNGKKNRSAMDDSSSTCSTDSIPSVVSNGPYKGNSLQQPKSQTSPKRSSDVARGGNGRGSGPKSEASLPSFKDRSNGPEQSLPDKEEAELSRSKQNVKNRVDVDMDRPSKQLQRAEESSTPHEAPTSNTHDTRMSTTQPKEAIATVSSSMTESVAVRDFIGNTAPTQQLVSKKPTKVSPSASSASPSNFPVAGSHTLASSSLSRPLSAPLIPGPRPTTTTTPPPPVSSLVQSVPPLSRSVSASGRLGMAFEPPSCSSTNTLPLPNSYRNAIMGKARTTGSGVFPPPIFPSPSYPSNMHYTNNAHAHANANANASLKEQPSQSVVGSTPGFTFGTVTPELLLHESNPSVPPRLQQEDGGGMYVMEPPSITHMFAHAHGHGHGHARGMGPMQEHQHYGDERLSLGPTTSSSADDFPHLDIINSLLDEEYNMNKVAAVSAILQRPSNNSAQTVNRQLSELHQTGSLMGSMDMAGPSSLNYCGFERRFLDQGIMHRSAYDPLNMLMGGESDGHHQGAYMLRSFSQPDRLGHQWGAVDNHHHHNQLHQLSSTMTMDLDGYHPFSSSIDDYATLSCGYSMYRPPEH
ncbi:MATH domain-containing protein At5g43560 [Amborella trichopoda]|uniref:MATH domain-containing protein n=1 Tax=Amborella trichopoda TaxID=13333 RepID=W1NUA7_AMBTC|nr:MATH domain-containing protein At5g43560 [Amborella trichopoda]ERN01192.1 hypothetical protein AMTR_s00002p00232980 [Amborella trichopoda]|eukprot:XP_006838623.1 MATH domain-containing protein At5g43560 [Amborella trichopoda]